MLTDQLERQGFIVVLPDTAQRMRTGGLTNVEAVLDWSTNPLGYEGKGQLIRGHFNKIAQGDAILVANYAKTDKPDYIGPNVLMEMALAFYLRKQIYVLYGCPERSPLRDEILALSPMFLNGDMTKIIGQSS